MHLIHDLLLEYGYLAAFAFVFAAGANLPVPGNVAIVIAGALITRGYFRLELILPLLFVGNTLGDITTYWLSRRFTARTTWERRAAKHGALGRLERYLKRRPLFTVIGSRFVPFVNGGVTSLAGMCRLSPLRFAFADALGNAVYVTSFLLLGLAFGKAWGEAAAAVAIGGIVVTVLVGLTIVGLLMVGSKESHAAAA